MSRHRSYEFWHKCPLPFQLGLQIWDYFYRKNTFFKGIAIGANSIHCKISLNYMSINMYPSLKLKSLNLLRTYGRHSPKFQKLQEQKSAELQKVQEDFKRMTKSWPFFSSKLLSTLKLSQKSWRSTIEKKFPTCKKCLDMLCHVRHANTSIYSRVSLLSFSASWFIQKSIHFTIQREWYFWCGGVFFYHTVNGYVYKRCRFHN